MSGWHLLEPNFTAGSVVTANTQLSAAVSAANLLRIQQSRKWRATSLATLEITIDAGEARPWNAVYLGYHNASPTGYCRVTSNATTGSLFSTPTVDYLPATDLRVPGDLYAFSEFHTFFMAPTTHTFRYIGIEIQDGDNPDGYFEAGVVMAGTVFTPRIGPELGGRWGREDTSTAIRMLDGTSIVRQKRGYDTASWTFPHQPVDDAMKWQEINRIYGSKIPVVCKWEPDHATDYQQHCMIYGYLQWRSGGPLTSAAAYGYTSVDVGINEV